MSDTSVTVLVRLKARPGKEEELKNALAALLEPSRADAGCINYDCHTNPEDPSEFMFYENWTSKALLDAHLKTPHLIDFKAKMDDLLDGPLNLTLWERMP